MPTILNRLEAREGGDTRFNPENPRFDDAIQGYQEIKSIVQTSREDIPSITVENERQEDLNPNTAQIADAIRSART
jgi:hypothetical protein